MQAVIIQLFTYLIRFWRLNMENLTNPGKDPVDGDNILKREGGLKIYYQHSTQGFLVEEEARNWRNEELTDSDWVMAVSDHPQFEAYKTYRTKLRDWPSTSDFPDTKPTL